MQSLFSYFIINLGKFIKFFILINVRINMAIEISAGSIIFLKEDSIKYLVLYKKANPPYKEGWDFPRGNIEEGESELETVSREVKEETGITYLKFVKNFREQVSFFYRKEGKVVRKTIVYYLAETNSKNVVISDEHDDYAWLDVAEALARLKHKDTKTILEKAHRILAKEFAYQE